MKKSMILMAAFAMISLSMSAQGQRQRLTEEEIAKLRAEQVQKQADRLAKDLELKDDAKAAFVATYTEYQDALAKVRMVSREEGREEADADRDNKKEKNLSDEEATKRLEEVFARQEEQIEQSKKALEVTREYYAKFKETLTPQQLLKVFSQQQRGGRGGRGGEGGQGGPMGGGQGGPMGGGPMGGGPMGGGDF